jgi:beta-lactamase regulating signal transducer with metallopeptidase domain
MIPALVNHLWQSTLFALGAGLLTLTLRRNGAGVRHGLWLAASVKFLIPFALLAAAGDVTVARLHLMVAPPPSIAMPSLAMIAPVVEPLAPAPVISVPASITTVSAPPHAAIPARHADVVPFDPAPILLGVWALGLAVVLLVWAVRWSRIRAALSAASPIDLPAPVPVLSSPALLEPGVVGILRPVLLVPEGIAERLSSAELSAVIDHELRHIRRRDNLTGAIHMLVEALFWFHPLVWWLGARLIDERERACDEAVVRAGADPRTYAEAILKVCRLYLRQPLACAAGVSGADLKRRMLRIMADPISLRLGVPKKLLLAAAALLSVAAPVSAGLFASVPMAARAQAASAGVDPSRAVAQVGARQAVKVIETAPVGATATQTPVPTVTPIAVAQRDTVAAPENALTSNDAHAPLAQDIAPPGLEPAPPPAAPRATVPPVAAPPAASSGPTPYFLSDPITVLGKLGNGKSPATNFVHAYSGKAHYWTTIFNWDDPICVTVAGLQPDQDAAVKARVEAVARAAGVTVRPDRCGPNQAPFNIEIFFTPEPQRVLDAVAKSRPWILGTGDAGDFLTPKKLKARAIVTRPIQGWYATTCIPDVGWGPLGGSGAAIGASNGPPGGGAGCGAITFLNVMVVVDRRRTADKSLGAVSDFAAMLALSQPKSLDGCNTLPSVIDLFACPDRPAPAGLTAVDTAYLKALYTGTGQEGPDLQAPGDVAARMTKILGQATITSR